MRRLAAGGLAGIALVFSLAVPARVAPIQGPQRGGTLRIGFAGTLGFTDSFDPSGEYHGFAWAIYSNLLLRTLVTYRHVEGPDGAVLVPDLATELPEPADGGLTYTFHLKHNIRFGPPLSRGIRSRDIAYAFERIGDPRVAAQYGFYYINLIKGMKSFNYGHSDHISGIETPDDRTIVFHLKRATGDFLYRVSMPATAPIPRKVAHCFRSAGDYGRFVIASGPYMLEGSEDLDIGHGCEGMRRISGYDPSKRITMSLVRNPDYDTRTDDREIRENLVDRVEFRSYENTNQMFRHIEHGKLESAAYEPRPKRIRRYENHPELNATLQSSHLDRTWYLTMNLTQPPFDDVHVRKAVNLVIDKAAIRDKWGGDFAGRVATHILPPDMTTGHPDASEYDPYPSPGSGGDVDAAREEMKQSRYDTDDDGLCDADECHEVLALSRNYDPWGAMDDGIVADLAKIGIDLRLRERADFYTPIQTVQKSIPIGLGPGWGKDYPDGHTFMPLLFGEEGLLCTGNTNYSLVGATPRTKKKCRASGDFSNVPSVQADIDTCDSTPVGDDRTACWVDLDKHLMEDVVPWVPYLWDDQISLVGPGVSKYEFDQFSGYFAFAHMAVDKTRQKGLAPGG